MKMKRTTKNAVVGIALAGLLLAAATAGAEPGADPGKLEDRVDLALKNAAPEEVFRTFAKMLGVEAVVDPGVHGPLSVELHNVRVRTLLDTVCESLSCRWRLEAGSPPKLRVVPIGSRAEGTPTSGSSTGIKEPIDLKVTKADGLDVMRTFGDLLSADVVVEPGLKGTVTLDLESVPVGQTLDAVCQELGCEWSFTEGANGRKAVLRISLKKR
jgi:type II secretory pathway component GspD/PulD (secretin)